MFIQLLVAIFFVTLMSFFFLGKRKQFEHVVFTDPAVKGITKTGDVDDWLAIIFMALRFGKKVLFVISDEQEIPRYQPFMERMGKKIASLKGCSFIRETDLEDWMLRSTTVHLYAPIMLRTAELFRKENDNIRRVYTQGDKKDATNFKSDGGKNIFPFLITKENVTMFSSTLTNVSLPVNDELKASFKGIASLTYQNLVEYQFNKQFALAIIPGLIDRLYSDTGFEGRPGNGVFSKIPLINDLRGDIDLLPLNSEKLEEAVEMSLLDKTSDETTKRNVHNLVALLNMYTDYEQLLVNGQLPTLDNLGVVQKRDKVDERVDDLFKTKTTTAVFDFVAAWLSTNDKISEEWQKVGNLTDEMKSTIVTEVEEMLKSLNSLL